MRKLKNYFKLIVTAVICFFVSFISGKKENEEMKKVLAGGQAFSNHSSSEKNEFVWKAENRRNSKFSFCNRYGQNFKKIFFWMQGPGDHACYGIPQPYG